MGNRGTSKDKPKKQDVWTGDEFKKDEEERLFRSGVDSISINRGTDKISTKEVKTTKKPKYKGKIHGGRGTSTN